MQQNKALIHDLTNKNKLLYNLYIRGTQLFLTHAVRQRIKIIGISLSILQVLCKYKIVQKNLFKWTELNSVRFYVIRKISTCQ